jgi:chemotaxis signal transduction protein
VFRDGGQLVAVADLRRWMATPPPAEATPEHVMVLCFGERSIGLAVDAVRGLVRLRASNIARIHHTEQADGFFHSIGTRADGSLITLLDPAVLVDQVGAWSPGIKAGAATDEVATVDHDSAIQALIRIGDIVLGFPATMVGEIVKEVTTQPLQLGGGQVTGTTRWRGRLTPVLDPARTVLAAEGGNALTVILAHGELTLAFPVDEVLAVRTFQAAQVQDAATAGLDGDIYLGYATEESGRRILLVNGPALLARYAVQGLGVPAATKQATPGRSSVPAHVVYDAGQMKAAPMHALREIVPLPAGYRASTDLADGIDGQCNWRGRMLPVIDLRTADARADVDNARLMVAYHGEREVGLLVRDVVALLPANTGERMRFTMPGGRAMNMITVGAAGSAGSANGQTSYEVLDVAALPYLAA